MSKTKVLIIGMSLEVGGAEKSLVNLLNMIDYKKYEVDLLLFQYRGNFLADLPSEVNQVHIKEIDILFQPLKETLKQYKGIHALALSLKRYIYTFKEQKTKQFDRIRLNRWLDYFKELIPENKKEYDVGVAYVGGETAYYLFDKVKCKRRVYFFHSDFSKINIDADLERRYVLKSDLVVTISETCKESLIKIFPELADKICVLQNLSSPRLIEKLSNEFTPKEYDKNYPTLVSVGRLNKIKGYDMAVSAAKILKEKGIRFRWYIVGEGGERKDLEERISEAGVGDYFFLLGLRRNPYPYIKNADIVVQTSRFEGKSLVLDEAKILKKCIVATHYNSVEDQVEDGVSGIIVPMTPEGIAAGLENLLNNKEKLLALSGGGKIDKNIIDAQNYMSVLCGEKHVG